jgi:Rho-binding antiterminator
MDRPYHPISCAVHDRLLALATLRREADLTVAREDGRSEVIRGLIVDVYSRSGAEYLELVDGRTYRLDCILALDGEPVGPVGGGGEM